MFNFIVRTDIFRKNYYYNTLLYSNLQIISLSLISNTFLMYFQSDKAKKLLKPFYKPYHQGMQLLKGKGSIWNKDWSPENKKICFLKVSPLAHHPPSRNENTVTGNRRHFSETCKLQNRIKGTDVLHMKRLLHETQK